MMVNEMENYPCDKAIEIVRDYLKLDKFIRDNKDNIIEQLKDFSNMKDEACIDCENKDIPEGIKFLSQTLPFMSGIINVGAKAADFVAAKKEIGRNFGGSVIYIFSIYTFIYIIENIVEDKKLKAYLEEQVKWLCNMPKNKLDGSAGGGQNSPESCPAPV